MGSHRVTDCVLSQVMSRFRRTHAILELAKLALSWLLSLLAQPKMALTVRGSLPFFLGGGGIGDTTACRCAKHRGAPLPASVFFFETDLSVVTTPKKIHKMLRVLSSVRHFSPVAHHEQSLL